MRPILACLVFAFACSSKSATPDAPSGTPDAPSSIDAPSSDTPGVDGMNDAAAAACTGALYDGCTDNTKCTSANCHEFPGGIVKVCTQACDVNNPCPQQNGLAVPCVQALCRPDMANNCTPQ